MSCDKLHRIVAMQQFDGSYNLEPTLCAEINVAFPTAMDLVKKKGWNPKGYAVTLVLAFFREKLESLQNDWELVADKSRIWLIGNAAKSADEMFDSAMKAVAQV